MYCEMNFDYKAGGIVCAVSSGSDSVVSHSSGNEQEDFSMLQYKAKTKIANLLCIDRTLVEITNSSIEYTEG